MLQKVLVVLVGLVMSLVGALSPSSLFAGQPLDGDVGALPTREETLATVNTADGTAFARVSVLWVEADGRRVTEDAWGSGAIQELRFKVGVKGLEGLALALGDRFIELKPTDVLTVRMFRGDFSYRGMGTTQATLQLQGTVETTLLAQGDATHRVRTETDPLDLGVTPEAPSGGTGEVGYVVLDTGQKAEVVSVEDGGGRLFTEEAARAAEAKAEPGNLLARWVKIDGKLVREYTWGDGTIGEIEFEPAAGNHSSVVVAFDGSPTEVDAGSRVVVRDFVGEYLVYQVEGGLVRVRLDGYASDYRAGAPQERAPASGGSPDGSPLADFTWTPERPKTTDTVVFTDASQEGNGVIVLHRWDFGDGDSQVLEEARHRFRDAGAYEVTLTVTDSDLKTSSKTVTIVVDNAPPVSDFDFAPKRVTTGSLVSFTDRSQDTDGRIEEHRWDFGDGETSPSPNPTHRFATPGSKTVTLTTVDDMGAATSISKIVIVENTPPGAAFTYTPSPALSLLPIQFRDNSSDGDGQIVAWNWSFGDGDFASESNPTHAFPRPGLFSVRLTVWDDADESRSVTQQLLVQNRPPLVDFEWDPQGAEASTPVTFVSRARDLDGLVVVNTWDFGDGSSRSVGDVVKHYFPRAGTYNVTLSSTDNTGATTTFSRSISVANSAPRASMAITPNPAFRAQAVSFADISTDPDGDAIVRRVWDFGDGSAPAYTSVANHTYARADVYQVKLEVEDARGRISYATATLPVLNRPPEGALSIWPPVPIARQIAFFNATDVVDPDGSSGAVTATWEFSDMSEPVPGLAVTRVFERAGTFQVRLVLRDAEGAESGAITKTFGVDFAKPEPSFTFTPSLPAYPQPGAQVAFTDASTSPNGNITGWSWDFGDNTFSSEQSPTHAFPEARVYAVRLTVTDEVGAQFTARRDVIVNAPPVAVFTGPTAVLGLRQDFTFEQHAHDPDGSIQSYHWSFGDGRTSTQPSPTHNYSTPGPHRVTLTVTDNRSASAQSSLVVDVANRAPVARWDLGTARPTAGQPVTFLAGGRSFDPDGQTIVSYNWSFGDGFKGSGATVEHVYSASGYYPVSLRVSDGLATSVADPPSIRSIRVGAAGTLVVTVTANHPNGGPLDIGDPNVRLDATLGQGIGVARGFGKDDFTLNATDPRLRDLVIPAGDWVAGETLTLRLRHAAFQTEAMQQVITLYDRHAAEGPLQFAFDVAVPLVPTLEVDAGSSYLPLPLGLTPNETTDGETPVYRDVRERFAGTGRVTFLDGAAAPLADVVVEARYLPLDALRGARDLAALDTPVLGWCKVDEATTDANGDFAWSAEQNECVASAVGLFPAGRWEFRAKASLAGATSGTSQHAEAIVDPTGGYLWALPGLP